MLEPDRLFDRLDAMREMISAVQRRMMGLSKAAFEDDSDEIDLLAFRLAQIGESANRMPSELRMRYPDIPWPKIIGLRNLIVHEYRRVIPGRLWETANGDLEPLVDFCRLELARLGE